jgi:endogenous inhibitor of DNA gyrase (YacG/DUF329 family)
MSGHWETIHHEWFDTNVINCDLCGKMIPRRIWKAAVHGREHDFCSKECERMYIEYWLPRYGQHKKEITDQG